MKTINERIAETSCEIDAIYVAQTKSDSPDRDALARLMARAEKRLADLEAVRDGKAVEVWATVSARPSTWISYGHDGFDPDDDEIIDTCGHVPGTDHLTILRGIVYLLERAHLDEAEAESEAVDV